MDRNQFSCNRRQFLSSSKLLTKVIKSASKSLNCRPRWEYEKLRGQYITLPRHLQANPYIYSEKLVMEIREEIRRVRKRQRWLERQFSDFVDYLFANHQQCETSDICNEASYNRNLTLEVIERYPEMPWCFSAFARNSQIPREDIIRHRGLFQSCQGLSEHPGVTWDFVRAHPEITWSKSMLASNPGITFEDILGNPGFFANTDYTSLNPNLTWEIIQGHSEYPWCYYTLSAHPCVTWDIMQQNPQLRWDIDMFCSNPNFTWDLVRSHPEIRWNYPLIAAHPSVTWEIFAACQSFEKRWFSGNPNVTWELIKDNPKIDWDFSVLSHNPGITPDIVMSHPECDWYYRAVLQNENYRHRLDIQELKLKRQRVRQTTKNFYYQLIRKMSLPPDGYYFRMDLLELQRLNLQECKKI